MNDSNNFYKIDLNTPNHTNVHFLVHDGVKFLVNSYGNPYHVKVHIIQDNGTIREIGTAPIYNNTVCIDGDILNNLLDKTVGGILCKNSAVPVVANSRKQKEKKRNPIQVVRYIRPLDEHCGDNSNLYGVTLVFTLDYDNRKIDVGISICNGDNFSRKEGIKRAMSGKLSITDIYMPDEIYHCNGDAGLVEWFVAKLPHQPEAIGPASINIGYNSIKLMCEMYAYSERV